MLEYLWTCAAAAIVWAFYVLIHLWWWTDESSVGRPEPARKIVTAVRWAPFTIGLWPAAVVLGVVRVARDVIRDAR